MVHICLENLIILTQIRFCSGFRPEREDKVREPERGPLRLDAGAGAARLRVPGAQARPGEQLRQLRQDRLRAGGLRAVPLLRQPRRHQRGTRGDWLIALV